MLVPLTKILSRAVRGDYAVGAFNVNNLESVLAVIAAAEKLSSPAIIQVTEGAAAYAGLETLAALISAAATRAKVPLALHLDHGRDFSLIKRAIAAGFSSVMIDASDLPFEQNVTLTRKVVRYAHFRGVSVQAELGRLAGSEDWQTVKTAEAFLTDPVMAARFVTKTGIDALAPAVGNYHGVAKIREDLPIKLDLKRLKNIAKIVPVPLVLHGASGLSSALTKKIVQAGVRVFNIDSELRLAFVDSLRKTVVNNQSLSDPRLVLKPSIVAMSAVVMKKMSVCGSRNRG